MYSRTMACFTEVHRICRHLALALEKLQGGDVTQLGRQRRDRRTSLCAELARYRTRCAFPQNDFAPDSILPAFVDSRGTRCALAHLIEMSGNSSLVERVAATANHAFVCELAGDAELSAWLEQHGITMGEAAAIQPSYCGAAWQCVCHEYPNTILEGVLLSTTTLQISIVYGENPGLAQGDTVAMDEYFWGTRGETWLAGYEGSYAVGLFRVIDDNTLRSCSNLPQLNAPNTLSKQALLDIAIGGADCKTRLAAENSNWLNEINTCHGYSSYPEEDESGCSLAPMKTESELGVVWMGAALGAACILRRRAAVQKRRT